MSGAAQRLIAVVGPTGTGKSDLAVAIAEAHAARGGRAEIVNADAMQLYRGMDIGTAKLTEGERRGIPHHLLDVLDVTEEAAVARYQSEARAVIDRLLEEGVTPVLVGGSGLYVSGVVFDFSFPGTDEAVRARLERELTEQGTGALYARLSALDAEAARRIGPHNARRIVRALEVAAITGSPSAGMLPERPVYWSPTTLVGLRMDREALTGRLDARVTGMWESGLLDEVARLREQGLERGVTASRAIGYAQALAQLDGRMSEQDAIAETQRLTRRYARRQMSWFRRYDDLRWFDVRDTNPAEARSAAVGYVEHLDEAGHARP